MTTTPTTTTAASVYQELRSHLAELKLADAAAALPGVLDQATTEGWTVTAALEHLLRIEVTATEARRLAGRFRFANLPTGATLADFDLDPAATSTPPPTCSSSALQEWARPTSPPGSDTQPSKPATARISPQRRTSRPAATAPRSKANGRP